MTSLRDLFANYRKSGGSPAADTYDDEPEVTLGSAQQAALDAAMAGKSLAILGPGGCGKSAVTKQIIRRLRSAGKRVAVTGSTGMAAVNIGGVTIHSCLGTGRASNKAEVHKAMTGESVGKAADRVGDLDVIVVDEISMLSGDYLDMADWWLNLVRSPASYQPFGGLQMILVGDLLQLPAVITDDMQVSKRYAFQADVWAKAAPEVHILRHNYRQAGDDEADFRAHLLRIRKGRCPEDTLDFFNARVGANLIIPPTCIYPTNREADRMNAQRMAEINAPVWEGVADFDGHPSWIDALKRNMPVNETIELKAGCEILIKRNSRERLYVNGSRGVVVSCDADGVVVRLHADGSEVKVARETWEMKDASDRVLASVRQFPIRLGYASTAHSLQGTTLDSVAYDPRRTFERAQTYIALSRCRSYTGLKLLAPLRPSHVRASKTVVDWLKAHAVKQG